MFDEIYRIDKENRRSIPFEEYFDGMDLTEEEKEERKSFAEKMNEIILFIFFLFIQMKGSGYFDRAYIIGQLRSRYSDLVMEKMVLDKYFKDYIKAFSEETIDTTINHDGEEYYLSDDRAIMISENEAVTAYAHSDFANAVKAGKTRKQWITERDSKVRETHREVDGKSVPIEEPFRVGSGLMLYPKDGQTYGASAKEIVGCRCVARYY